MMAPWAEGASEPELRDDEAVCEVSGYTYNRFLPRSPWVDENGKQLY